MHHLHLFLMNVTPAPLPTDWLFWRGPAERAPLNMAWDDILLEESRHTARGIFRCYAWSVPAVSFGRHERIRGRFVQEEITGAGLDAVRRPTGGRALLHVHEVTYGVAIPLPDKVTWRAAYEAVNHVLLNGLRSAGIDAKIASNAVGDLQRPGSTLCFAGPSTGEIVVDGAKLVGSAVWRTRGAFLQQGSILLDGDQSLLASLARDGNSNTVPVATIRMTNPALDHNAVVNCLRDGLSAAFTVNDWQPGRRLQREALSRVNHYVDPDWLWRQ